ncbi:MAG: peptidoglycan-associated lipoprotein Pal [Pseudomonadota bacterium]
MLLNVAPWDRGSMLRRALVVALVVGTAALAAACAKSQRPGGGPLAANGANGPNGADPRGGPVRPGTSRDFSVNVGDIVYFTTNSTQLSVEAQQTLAKQSQWLRRYPRYTITIEGHADERGTREYNIALGAKRATAVRNYLVQRGVNGARIRTISYGKERPVAVCNDISCWSQNRRAQTVLNLRRNARL